METKIPVDVVEYIRYLECCFDAKMFFTGGCLCEHDTQDYDVFVQTNKDPAVVFHQLEAMYKSGIFDSICITTAYEDQDDNVYHTIAKVTHQGVKIDLLFLNNCSMFEAMDEFPLSVQMRFLRDNRLFKHPKFSEDPIIVYKRGKHEERYRMYYPDRKFIYAEDS